MASRAFLPPPVVPQRRQQLAPSPRKDFTVQLGRRRPLAVPGLVIASQSLCGGRTRTVRHQGGGYRVAHGGKMLMPPQIPC